jgi:hypothetical protein
MPSRDNVDYKVFLEGIWANDPDADGVSGTFDYFDVLTIAESAGAAKLDTAVLDYKQAVLEDFDPYALLGLEIEIQRIGGSSEIVHWGKITQLPITINPRMETLRIQSRTELYHLGGKVNGYHVYDPATSATRVVDGELIFNPLIDGTVYGNRNDTRTTAGGDPVFLDPESVRTAAAVTYQGGNIATWTLAEAIYYLLWSLNTAQTNIANETLGNLQAVFNDPTVVIRDLRIARGTWLAEALDVVLTPLGYQWKVSRTALGARIYSFWKKGNGGTLRSVSHQRLGSTLVPASTNVEAAGLKFDVSSLANDIVILGGYTEYEITAELARAWPESDDPPPGIGDELSTDHPDFESKKDVLRRWVLNEAGDYIGLRPELDDVYTSDIRDALSAAGIAADFVPRRRRLLPTLTLDANGEPIGKTDGVEVEYSDELSSQWKPVTGWGCGLLKHEAGVYFDFDRPPDEFMIDPDNLRIRATFTIQSDLRLFGYAPKVAGSPNSEVVQVVVSAPDRFRLRARLTGLSKYAGGATASLAVDDTTPITDFAAYARAAWDLMHVGGAIQLEGLDRLFYVGDRISGVDLKNIDFEARPSSGVYPQIVAIEREITNQVTTLHLEHFRQPLTLPTRTRGTSSRFSTKAIRGQSL